MKPIFQSFFSSSPSLWGRGSGGEAVFFFFLLLLFSSCTQEDRPGYSGDPVPVTFSLSGIGSSSNAQSVSRAAGTPLPDGATVRVLAYHRPGGSAAADLNAANYAGEATYQVSGGGTALTPCTVDDKGAVTSTSGQPMQLLVGAYDFFTVTPALMADHTGEAPVVTVANGVDYASSVTENRTVDPAGETRGQAVTLEKLNRQCCKLNFIIQCDETVNTLTGIEVEELKLTGLSDTPLKTVAMTAQAGVIRPAGNFTLTLNGTDLPTDAVNAKLAKGSVIVLPKAAGAFGVSMQLCLNGSIVPTAFDEVEVPAMSFDAGREYPMTITLSHGGAVTLTLGSAQSWGDGGNQNQNAGFLPGVTVGMPNWTLDEQAQGLGNVPDLSRNGTANCYIVYDNESYYGFDATVMGNGAITEAATLGGTANGARIVPQTLAPQSAKVLWETGSVRGAVVSKVQLSPDKTKVLFKTGTDAGNAVIAVYDNADPDNASAKILWSWHIWKPADAVADLEVQKYVDNNNPPTMENFFMMDRNLGATVATPGAAGALGLMYQWGRKDPFPGAKDKNTSEYMATVTSSGTSLATSNQLINTTTLGTDVPSLTDNAECLAYAIENPTTFFKANSYWRYDWIKDRQDNLWGNPWEGTKYIYSVAVNSGYGSKSIYDPCPVGYRVAPHDAWTALLKADGNPYDDARSKFDVTDCMWSSTSMSPTGSAVSFPASGYVAYSDGTLGSVGSIGFYWYSSVYKIQAGWDTGRAFYFKNDSRKPSQEYSHQRTSGFSVRCVRELD